MVAEFTGGGGPAKELAKIRYITQVHSLLRALPGFGLSHKLHVMECLNTCRPSNEHWNTPSPGAGIEV